MDGIRSAHIAFAGTPAFAVPTLDMLVADGADVPVVLTQPDRPAGRGRRLTPSPVKELAVAHGLRVEQPARLDDPTAVEDFGPPPEILLVIAYGLLLPDWLLDWPTKACVNLHASLLPRWRGAAPIQHAILAGDPETGVSVMQMDSGLDTGPVYLRRAMPIAADETAATLHDRLSGLAAALARECLPAIIDGRLKPHPQPTAGACTAPKIRKADAILDWTASAVELERRVRAFDPWPIAETRARAGLRLRIWRAVARAQPTAAAPGTVVGTSEAGIDVATGEGLLRLTRVQAPGSRPMEAAAYLAAHNVDRVRFGTS